MPAIFLVIRGTVQHSERSPMRHCGTSGILRNSVVVLSAVTVHGLAQALDPGSTTNGPEFEPRRLEPVTIIGRTSQGSTTTFDSEIVAARTMVAPLELTGVSPNFAVFQADGDRVPRFSLRGLRENGLTTGGPTVTLYSDDVPYDTLFFRGGPYFDINSIEILRGPQGTRFGASRPGGVVDIHSHVPGNEWRGTLRTSYANYDSATTDTALSGPVWKNTLYAGVAGLFSRSDGFVRNTVTGDYADSTETLAGRAQVRWTPTPTLELMLTASGSRFDDGLQAGVPLGQDLYTVSRTFNGYSRQHAQVESLRVAYTGEKIQMMSVTAHSDYSKALLQDADFMPLDLVKATVDRSDPHWTQEIRVQYRDSASPWRWSGGGFFADSTLHLRFGQIYTIPPGSAPLTDRTTKTEPDQTYALFGQASRVLFNRLEITAGVRFEYVARESTATEVNELAGTPGAPLVRGYHRSADYLSWQPKFEAAYQFSDAARAWFSLARGFQPGGFNFANSAAAPPTFTASDSWHYEVGGSSKWLNDRVTSSVTAFYNDLYDYQVYRPTGIGAFVILNADRAHTMGIESELKMHTGRHWEFTLRGGWISARLDRFDDTSNSVNLDGKAMDFVPQYTLSGDVKWSSGRGWFAQVGAQGIGWFWLDEANTQRQSTYWLLNARAGYEGRIFGLAGFGRNLLDTRYIASAFHFTLPSGDIFTVAGGAPVVVGIEVFARF